MASLETTQAIFPTEDESFDFSLFVLANKGTLSIQNGMYPQPIRGFEHRKKDREYLTIELFFNGPKKEKLFAVLVECIDFVGKQNDSVGVHILQKDTEYPKPRKGYGGIFIASPEAWLKIQSQFITELNEIERDLQSWKKKHQARRKKHFLTTKRKS